MHMIFWLTRYRLGMKRIFFLLILITSVQVFAQKSKIYVYVDDKLEQKIRSEFDTSLVARLINRNLQALANDNYLDARLEKLEYKKKR